MTIIKKIEDKNGISMSGGINPMHQFELTNLINIEAFGHNFSITNGALTMFGAIVFVLIISFLLGKFNKIIPNRLQSGLEMSMLTIKNICAGSLGEIGKKYVPFVFSIFLFVLTLNLFGLIPGSFAQTSHISITFTLALVMFFVCIAIIIAKRGLKAYKIFIPSGTPWWLVPLMFILEMFSFFVRPVSLAVRLAANMIAGHVMLDVIAFFVIMLGVAGVIPFAFLAVMMAFELFVALLQAYIFSVFSCVYINEALEGGH